jgi:hypothetical protein
MIDGSRYNLGKCRLAFATRRVDLMAAGIRAPMALCADGMTIVGKNSTGCEHLPVVVLVIVQHWAIKKT